MCGDMVTAIKRRSLFLTGEVVWAAKSVAEKTRVKWVSTSVAPISFFSIYDPPVPPPAPWFEHLRVLGPGFQRVVNSVIKKMIGTWYGPYKEFRRDLGLNENHDPLFDGKSSDLLHLAVFLRVLGAPQSDWPPQTVQTGFCFYDGQEYTGVMPEGLSSELPGTPANRRSFSLWVRPPFSIRGISSSRALRPPSVSVAGRYSFTGHENAPPEGLISEIVGYPYAPYSLVFSKAACVVHQGGVGTTGQVLRPGVPHLIMPFGHDEPDNAARCRRIGVAEIVRRSSYDASTASAALQKILGEMPVLRES